MGAMKELFMRMQEENQVDSDWDYPDYRSQEEEQQHELDVQMTHEKRVEEAEQADRSYHQDNE